MLKNAKGCILLKKVLALVLVLMCFMSGVSAVSYTDVDEHTSGREAIEVLSDMGIITGFPDGSFHPEDGITRAEAAAVIVRAAEYSIDDGAASEYVDVAEDYWGKRYIMAASREKIVNGMGDGRFAPEEKVTYGQILKMLVCVVGAEEQALENGGWVEGYYDTALEVGVINSLQHYILERQLEEPAKRADVAKYVYATLTKMKSAGGTFGGQEISLGQSTENIGEPDEVLASTAGFEWYVYGTKNYKNFYAVGVKEEKVVALCAVGDSFEYNGYRAGDVVEAENDITRRLATDSNDGGKVHGVMLSEHDFILSSEETGQEALSGESKMNFHCTNAFRVMHGEPILKWSEPCANAARLHSQDMADRDYFKHDSLDGRKFFERLKAQGVDYSRSGENIYAGLPLGFYAYDGWVNSAGHRTNMLGDFSHLGVGQGFNADSTYGSYFTQDFYKR